MDFKTKRLYKRKGIFYITLAWILIIVFSIDALLIIFNIANDKPNSSSNVELIILFITVVLFMTFTSLGAKYNMKRQVYLKNMLKYKQYRYFQIILVTIQMNKLNHAIDMYNKLLVDGDHKNYIFANLIFHMLNSDDSDLKQKGLSKFNMICDTYNPDNIKF